MTLFRITPMRIAFAAFLMLHVAQRNAIWITHAGVIRAVTLLTHGPAEQLSAHQWPREAPGYGQWLELSL